MWRAPPSRLAELYGESFARQDLGPAPIRLPVRALRSPAGAGLVLRRDAVDASRWLTEGRLAGRRGRHLGSGEDHELVFALRNAGWEVWYEPALHLRHVVGPERTTLRSLARLHFCFGLVRPYLVALDRDELPSRHRALGRALGELGTVLARFPKGFVQYADERPTWVLRLVHAVGALLGVSRLRRHRPRESSRLRPSTSTTVTSGMAAGR